MIPTLDRSGSEKQLTLLASRLPPDEFALEVCALTRGGPYAAELRERGIKVAVLGKRFKFDPMAAWRLRRLIADRRPEIVHSWLFAANSYGRFFARRRVPIIIASERCADYWRGPAARALDRWLARRTDRVVANSEAVARFCQTVGVPSDKLVVIPNGALMGATPAVDRAAVRRQLDIPPDAYVLGFVGRLWPQKRVRDFIWTTELLHNFKDVYGLIVGDGPEYRALADFASKIRLSGRIRFTGARDDVPQLLAAMDVFVIPSEFEGMPNVVLEAMCAGLPVVASNIPGTDELVVDGQTGFLVPLGQTKAFAQRTNQLLDDADLRNRFGTAAQQRVREQFDVEKMVQSYIRLYRDLAAAKGIGKMGRTFGMTND